MVLSFDRYSRDDVIGEVMLEMENLNLKDSEVCPLSLIRDIAPRSMKVNVKTKEAKITNSWFQLKDQGRGELLVSVCHQPAAGRLTVVILKARNLPKMDITGMSGEDNKAFRSEENEFNSCEIYSRFIQFPFSQIHMSRFICFTKTREYRKRKLTWRREH